MNGTITISKRSDDKICVSIRDCASSIHFTDALMSLEDFAAAITGLAERPVELRVNGLEFVGKRKVSENREVSCPIDVYDRDVLSDWIEKNCQEEGWMVDSSLMSQGSVYRVSSGNTMLRYRVVKYVDQKEDVQ